MPGNGAASRGQASGVCSAMTGCGGGGGGVPAASSCRMRSTCFFTSASVDESLGYTVSASSMMNRALASARAKQAAAISITRARTGVIVRHAAGASQQPQHVAAHGAAVDGGAVRDVVGRRVHLVAPPPRRAKLLQDEWLACVRQRGAVRSARLGLHAGETNAPSRALSARWEMCHCLMKATRQRWSQLLLRFHWSAQTARASDCAAAKSSAATRTVRDGEVDGVDVVVAAEVGALGAAVRVVALLLRRRGAEEALQRRHISTAKGAAAVHKRRRAPPRRWSACAPGRWT
jgi:hypothetical protein